MDALVTGRSSDLWAVRLEVACRPFGPDASTFLASWVSSTPSTKATTTIAAKTPAVANCAGRRTTSRRGSRPRAERKRMTTPTSARLIATSSTRPTTSITQ